MQTHTLQTDDASVVYDVHGPLPPANGQPLLFMIGQPMQANGFYALAGRWHDRAAAVRWFVEHHVLVRLRLVRGPGFLRSGNRRGRVHRRDSCAMVAGC